MVALQFRLSDNTSNSRTRLIRTAKLSAPYIPVLKDRVLRGILINTKHLELHDNGIDIFSPTRPHDTLTFFQMVTMRLALVLKRANAHAVLSIA